MVSKMSGKLTEKIPFYGRVTERAKELGKRVEFMKDAATYVYSFCDDVDGLGIAAFEMKPNGRFELTTKTNSVIYCTEGGLIIRDLDTDRCDAIYPGDMVWISKGTRIKARTDPTVGFKCIFFTKPPLREVYPELASS